MPLLRLSLAFAASLFLHAVILAATTLPAVQAPRYPEAELIEARLLPPSNKILTDTQPDDQPDQTAAPTTATTTEERPAAEPVKDEKTEAADSSKSPPPSPAVDPPSADEPLPVDEPSLAATSTKATLAKAPSKPASVKKPPPASEPSAPKPAARTQNRFYPPEAIDQGLEGEVRLLVTLSDIGKVIEAKVVVSCGHPILDQAAVKAALSVGLFPRTFKQDLILPVVFKLQP